MRTACTPHAALASPLRGEAVVSGSTGGMPVTIDQFPAVILNAAMQPSAAKQKAAYIVAWRRCFAPT
ncbi:hypothetical protein ABIF65_008800 [Bradyrhizobium japonicum]|nr:hypothetical protein [Bradyrhizobium japonicum]MCP1774354.1 hypothetical protein [Bradyrhizobium japonicum]MCP1864607.1 hypothetical protein [Bradyrhizobium japonicum]MCP1895194.1 hypothetical protein [Bradyrhizobium japonicum]MCP1962645.1 hypothetical protein [Bradyrhizobium japonicum]